MKIGRLKNSITYLFLVLFLSMKMMGLHVLTHSGDQDHLIHCVICDHAIVSNHTPVVPADLQDFTFESVEILVHNETIITSYDFFSCDTITPDQLFSRPPPTSIS